MAAADAPTGGLVDIPFPATDGPLPVISRETLDVLVVAAYDGADAWAVRDFLFGFAAWSRHRYHYLLDPRRLGPEIDLAAYDVVLVFWSASLVEPSLDAEACERLASSPALKVVFAQDEHRDVNRRLAVLAELGVGVVFTCVAEADHDAFYPASALPRLQACYTVLPGYLPGYLEDHPVWRRTAAGRDDPPIDVGYRSRVPPFWLGDLARHKVRVAERLEPACRERALHTDVSVRELDRLYGAAWLRFLARSRCVLGSPSGASVVDFDGTVRRDTARSLARDPNATYGEVRARHFAARDGRLVIDTVSSRVFEAAALGRTLVQVVGAYGGVLEPDRHYIPVAPDYGNLDEVVERILDRPHCHELAAAAHRDLVASGRFAYRRFFETFDRQLTRHARRVRTRTRSRTAFHLRRAAFHRQIFLPAGAGAIVVPLPLPLATLALRRLPVGGVAGGPVLRRALRHPRGFADRLLALVVLLAREPAARALLRAGRTAEETPAAWRLAEDLLKLSLPVRARRGTLRTPRPFAADLELAPDEGTVWLVSRAVDDPTPTSEPDASSILGVGVRRVVWDHARVGAEATFAIGRRVATLSVGDGGVYVCEALSTLCRSAPETTLPVLAAWLGSGPPAR